jgi:hypothetical protein
MILLGKAVPAVIVALAQATIIILAAVLIYRVPFEGSITLLYGSACFYIFSLIGFGLLISAVCVTQQQAFLGVFCSASLPDGHVGRRRHPHRAGGEADRPFETRRPRGREKLIGIGARILAAGTEW